MFYTKIENFGKKMENFGKKIENFGKKFPKQEANFDGERGILSKI